MPDTMGSAAAKWDALARTRSGFLLARLRKARNRCERSAQALGIQAGLGMWRRRNAPRTRENRALLTYRSLRGNNAKTTANPGSAGRRSASAITKRAPHARGRLPRKYRRSA